MKGFEIFAHRGASAVAPESTLPAIEAAVACGADMIELDLQLTADNRLVVFHDALVERTTDGRGRLGRMRYRELSRLDAGSWFHPRFSQARILLASQALRAVPHPVRVNFELKRTDRGIDLLRQVRALLSRMRAWKRVLLSSFETRFIAELSGSRADRALICSREADASLDRAIALRCAAWHPHHSLVTSRRVRLAHAAGMRVHAWTVDAPGLALRLCRSGVDGVFTNDPLRLRGRLA